MKKFLVVFGLLLLGMSAQADLVESSSGVTMANFWEKNGKEVQKVLDVGTRIVNKNKLDKRIILRVSPNKKAINAFAEPMGKTVNIYTGIFPYFDSDDELAYVTAHEIAHCLDFYDLGLLRTIATFRANGKKYETKADLVAVDLMVKAGYNPIAAITAQNKILEESIWDNWFFTAHPKGSKRLLATYKYIYRKYPWALDSEMIHNVNYENFVNSAQKEITDFKQEDKARVKKRGEDL